MAAQVTPLDQLPPLFALRELTYREPTKKKPNLRTALEQRLTTMSPLVRAELPRDLDEQYTVLVRLYRLALTRVEESAGERAAVEAVLELFRDLGFDLAKYQVSEEQFAEFGAAMREALADVAGKEWTEELGRTQTQFYDIIARALAAGASEAEEELGANRFLVGARVVDVQRPTRGLAVVRLLTDVPMDYLPGQYMSVLTPYKHAVWRKLSPSIPANPARQIEFHVRAVEGGTLSPALVAMVAPGDRWVLSTPLGELEIARNPAPARAPGEGAAGKPPQLVRGDHQDVLIIAGGTGIAPVRSLILDISRFGDNPRVHLFYGARYPGELYDLHSLVSMSAHSPWLTVQPVAEEREDPWWLDTSGAEPFPQTLHRFTYGRLDKVVTAYGGWGDRQIILAGPPEMISATKKALIARGAPPENIQHDPLPGT
ncbi:FAD-binding oxidoreductase [Dietzia sp.]|uniref:FAD-binding oxidoreductase n=1 Tax=Dietzia sp. TaxID=1871616 RepID=UPI002FD9FD62